MPKYLLFFIVLFLKTYIIYGQPAVEEKDIKGAKKFSVRNFNGESLYGYIDGGADLYLEYGFSDVTVTEFVRGKSKYKVEVYRMKDPEAAFGIFSVSRFRCLHQPTFSLFTCHNRYQLQVCRGQYYINIINRTGTPADSTISATLALKLVSQIKDADFNPAENFPGSTAGDLQNNAYLVKGRLGIQNSVPAAEKYLTGARNYSALIFASGNYLKVILSFKSDLDCEDFLRKSTNGQHGKTDTGLISVWGIPLKMTRLNVLTFEIPVPDPVN